MKAMIYKGYAARIEFDAEDEIFTGRVAGIADVVGFHADTVPDLIAAFHAAIDDYLETCARAGREPQKAYSGNLMLRVAPQVHAQAAAAAEASGKTLNQWSEEVLAGAAAKVVS
jgi:predicted HicB family RNase H-like nuclease